MVVRHSCTILNKRSIYRGNLIHHVSLPQLFDIFALCSIKKYSRIWFSDLMMFRSMFQGQLFLRGHFASALLQKILDVIFAYVD